MLPDEADIAPPGLLWICPCCLKWGRDRTQVNDDACFLEAGLYKGDRLLLGKWRGVPFIYNMPMELAESEQQKGT
jgi:hypothetical protein